MIQKTYHIENDITKGNINELTAVLEEVAGLKEYHDAAQVLLVMMEQSWDEERIREKVSLIGEVLPKAEIAGVTHYDSFSEQESQYEKTLLSFLFFENPAFSIACIDMTGKRDSDTGSELGQLMQEEQDVKCVMTLFSKTRQDVDRIFSMADLGDVPVFGADASVQNAFEKDQ